MWIVAVVVVVVVVGGCGGGGGGDVNVICMSSTLFSLSLLILLSYDPIITAIIILL